jgi:methylase of polypeptide subunit release factors
LILETYVSSDDSELLRKSLKGESGETCLEIGVGYGSNLKEIQNNFDLSVGTDIRKTDAFRSKESLELIQADCGSCFRSEAFDLVLVNPPYLPSGRIEDSTIDGGTNGFEVARRFLLDAVRVLKSSGKILLVLSSETSLRDLDIFCNEQNLKFDAIQQKHLFFEDIMVFRLERKESRPDKL